MLLCRARVKAKYFCAQTLTGQAADGRPSRHSAVSLFAPCSLSETPFAPFGTHAEGEIIYTRAKGLWANV